MFFEVKPVYDILGEYKSLSQSFSMVRTNIKNYKNPKVNSLDGLILEKKIEERISLMTPLKQNIKGRTPREGYKVRMSIDDKLLLNENRLLKNKFIDETMWRLTTDMGTSKKEAKVNYFAFTQKTKKGTYLNILFFDYIFYDEGKIISTKRVARNNVYVDKKGFVVKKHTPDAVLVAKRGEKYQLKEKIFIKKTKERFPWIHSIRGNDNSLFAELIKLIKIQLERLQEKIVDNQLLPHLNLSRETLKKKTFKYGRKVIDKVNYYHNKKDNYMRRNTYLFNSLISTIESIIQLEEKNLIRKLLIDDIEDLKDIKNSRLFEEEIRILIDQWI